MTLFIVRLIPYSLGAEPGATYQHPGLKAQVHLEYVT